MEYKIHFVTLGMDILCLSTLYSQISTLEAGWYFGVHMKNLIEICNVLTGLCLLVSESSLAFFCAYYKSPRKLNFTRSSPALKVYK